jgi:hypothetical protein
MLETPLGAANQLYVRLNGLAKELAGALQQAAQQLNVAEIPQGEEFAQALREMPQLDLGGETPLFKRSPFVSVAAPLVKARVERRLNHLFGPRIREAFRSYRRLLEAWVRRASAEIQARFDSYADAYRAQLDRLLGPSQANPDVAELIRRDLGEIQLEPPRLKAVDETPGRTGA